MQMKLPEKVNRIIHCLQQHGFEAYAVGGCVRDTMLGRIPGDWDITTSAKPEQVKALFSHTIDTGIQHGTVTVMLEKEGFEVTTYRIDGEYEDARHPKEVVFTSNLIEDLKRRDFTINAMAYNEETGLVDAFDGVGDLKRNVICCVGCARERFEEDALRMLRAVRFSAQLGFTISKETSLAIKLLAPTLKKISAERIQVELVKLLVSNHPEAMELVYQLGMTDVFLPEFSLMMKTPQRNPHHCYTVGMHTIYAMKAIKADKVLRLTMLLHDVGKPSCRTTDKNGIDHFRGHQEAGAWMANQILRRLKFDKDTITKVCAFVRAHDNNPPLMERSIRREIVRNTQMLYPELFLVKAADIAAQSAYHQEEKQRYQAGYRKIYEQIMAQKDCLSIKDLAVGGKDLIALGMKPGKAVGEVLNQMLTDVLEHPCWNKKETLLERLKNEAYKTESGESYF